MIKKPNSFNNFQYQLTISLTISVILLELFSDFAGDNQNNKEMVHINKIAYTINCSKLINWTVSSFIADANIAIVKLCCEKLP